MYIEIKIEKRIENRMYTQILTALRKYCKTAEPVLTVHDFDDRIVAPLKHSTQLSFSYDNGVSKGVLLFDNFDKVIKIPFTGRFREEDYDDAVSAWDRGEEDVDEPQWEDFYEDFHSAATPQEIKEGIEAKWNYCELEVRLYQKAKMAGLEQYFAAERWIGNAGNIPIYAQEKVIPFDDTHYDEERSKATTQRCKELSLYCFNPTWIADFFEWYGEDEFIKLSTFLTENQITDLHDGNIGYIHGAPVMFDYSSYREYDYLP
jgi:hypothetical protein